MEKFILISFLFFCSCNTATQPETNHESTNTSFRNVDVTEAKKILGNTNYTWLDVRTAEEVADGKIGNPMTLDFYADDFKNQIANLPKQKNYIVYCKSGGRSAKACELMKGMGFNNVINLTGGYQEWSQSNK